MSIYNNLGGLNETSASEVGNFITEGNTDLTEQLDLIMRQLAYNNAQQEMPQGLVEEAQQLINGLYIPDNFEDIAYLEDAGNLPDVPPTYSYRPEATALNRLSQEVTIALMQKHGLISKQDNRRFHTYAGSKKPGKSNYGCFYSTNLQNDGKQPKPNVPSRSQGGPTDILLMYYPSEDAIEPPLTNTRLIRGIAHELAHQIRRVNNDTLWSKLPTELVEYYLVKGGNPKVGGNVQGSESVGIMFSRYALFVKKYGREPTINEFVSYYALDLQKRIDNYNAKGTIRTRYFISNFLTTGALLNLVNQGYGQASVSKILAICLCGYITLEKAHLLLEAGVVTQNMVNKNEALIRDITRWFITDEKGFIP